MYSLGSMHCMLQVPPLLSPEHGFPMQKACTALLIDALGRLLAASSDGCCYVLDPETLQRTARLILHPSQTGWTATFCMLVLDSLLLSPC